MGRKDCLSRPVPDLWDSKLEVPNLEISGPGIFRFGEKLTQALPKRKERELMPSSRWKGKAAGWHEEREKSRAEAKKGKEEAEKSRWVSKSKEMGKCLEREGKRRLIEAISALFQSEMIGYRMMILGIWCMRIGRRVLGRKGPDCGFSTIMRMKRGNFLW
jgi:hypothetical protein